MLHRMDPDAINQLIAAIEELERLYHQAKDDPGSPFWREMQKRLEEMQEQVERLSLPH